MRLSALNKKTLRKIDKTKVVPVSAARSSVAAAVPSADVSGEEAGDHSSDEQTVQTVTQTQENKPFPKPRGRPPGSKTKALSAKALGRGTKKAAASRKGVVDQMENPTAVNMSGEDPLTDQELKRRIEERVEALFNARLLKEERMKLRAAQEAMIEESARKLLNRRQGYAESIIEDVGSVRGESVMKYKNLSPTSHSSTSSVELPPPSAAARDGPEPAAAPPGPDGFVPRVKYGIDGDRFLLQVEALKEFLGKKAHSAKLSSAKNLPTITDSFVQLGRDKFI